MCHNTCGEITICSGATLVKSIEAQRPHLETLRWHSVISVIVSLGPEAPDTDGDELTEENSPSDIFEETISGPCAI